MRLHTFVSDNVRLFGTFDNNIYARPIDDDSTININNEYSGGDGSKNLTLAEWKVKYARDARSSKSAVITNKISNLIFDYSVERKEIQLKGIGKSVSGKAYDSGVRIGEYGGIVLIY